MRRKCASSVRVACAVFSPILTCSIIGSEGASWIISRVIHVLCVPAFCLRRLFWMRVLRYPCSVPSLQLQKDQFWAWAEDTPQGEEDEEEEQEAESSSSTRTAKSTSSLLRTAKWHGGSIVEARVFLPSLRSTKYVIYVVDKGICGPFAAYVGQTGCITAARSRMQRYKEHLKRAKPLNKYFKGPKPAQIFETLCLWQTPLPSTLVNTKWTRAGHHFSVAEGEA